MFRSNGDGRTFFILLLLLFFFSRTDVSLFKKRVLRTINQWTAVGSQLSGTSAIRWQSRTPIRAASDRDSVGADVSIFQRVRIINSRSRRSLPANPGSHRAEAVIDPEGSSLIPLARVPSRFFPSTGESRGYVRTGGMTHTPTVGAGFAPTLGANASPRTRRGGWKPPVRAPRSRASSCTAI